MATSSLSLPRQRLAVPGFFALGGAALGAAVLYGTLYLAGLVGAAPAADGQRGDATPADDPDVVTFEASKWEAAGLRVEPARYRPLLETLRRPGRINLKKVAQLAPMVDGIIRDVRVNVGQNVKAGDVLLILDSKELGQAKLELARARLSLALATTHHDWVDAVNKNTAELLQAMAQGVSIPDIEKRFTGRPIGDWRQQLITAYSRRTRSKANLQALEKLEIQGATSITALRTAQGEYETAEATFQAQREEIHFQNQHQLRTADHKLREAQGQVGVAETALLMLGYPHAEVSAMNPIAEGATIGYYPLRAPFDGTVLARPSQLGERAGPQATVVQIADLTQVWVQADLTESDLPAVRALHGKQIAFHGPGLDQPMHAEVTRVGDLVDHSTRTIPLVSLGDNSERLLKPGMFVEVELRHGPDAPVVQVPASAIVRHAGATFVFVPRGDDTFAKVDVKLGRATADAVEIIGGLERGQRIVVAGGFALKTEMLRATLRD
jgi:RND family efflux transporter MFP subunit